MLVTLLVGREAMVAFVIGCEGTVAFVIADGARTEDAEVGISLEIPCAAVLLGVTEMDEVGVTERAAIELGDGL